MSRKKSQMRLKYAWTMKMILMMSAMTAMIRGKIMMVRIWKIMTGGRIIMMLLKTIQKQNGVENGK